MPSSAAAPRRACMPRSIGSVRASSPHSRPSLGPGPRLMLGLRSRFAAQECQHQGFRLARSRETQAAVEYLVNETRAPGVEYRGVDIGFAANSRGVAQFDGHLLDHVGDGLA